MDLSLINDKNKSHYVSIKDFNRFMCNKTKNNNEKHFCECCLQSFSSEKVLQEHKETCLKINGKQTVKLKSGSIWFKNHFKQLVVPFKIYADFESISKRVRRSDKDKNSSYTEKYQSHIPCSFADKVVCIDDKFSKPIERFQSSNICWICNKLFDARDNKVRDHCHVTGKYRGSVHWSFNNILKLTEKIPVIFYKLRGFDSHLIMHEIDKFDVKVNVIPNVLEKYMALTINKNLVFVDSIQFMNSSLDALVKNLSDNDFKYLSKEFSSDLLELVKQKGVYPYDYMNSFKKFFEDKLLDRRKFFTSLKNECISEKDYSHAIDVWNMFKMNTMGDYHDLYLKTDVFLLADGFEKFISTGLDYIRLDSCHYFSSPGLS